MAMHMSLRLAWHSDGWNGHICKKPCENVYCVGQHSYPGEMIAEQRDLDFETAHAGEPCGQHPCKVACALSANAFGKETVQVKVEPPSWWEEKDADATILTLPPYTACTWCYEAMYKNDVFSSVKGKTYDYNKRQRNAEAYFSQFEEGKSLVFYYAGYSNPFSENEEDNYVIVGASRIKKIDDFHYYENTTDQIKKDYAGGVIWQKPITSNYPDEGLSMTGMAEYSGLDKLWQQAIRKADGTSNPDAIQIISPYRGEFYGTGALNVLMQNDFNPYWSHRYNLDGISYFDKVIQFRNRPKSDMAYAYNQETRAVEQHEVYNGEIGLVLMHPFDQKNKRYNYISTIERFQVAFSNKNRQRLRYNYGREYGRNDKGWNLPEQKVQENLELAYAISVHKSQGSEFDYVYIVIPKRDSHLLSMELLYTAITRAQKKVTILLQEDIGTLTALGHIEKSAVRRINSSVFAFNPLPEELLYIQSWYADEKKLATLSEYFVRSKSEVIIANMLVSEEVPFVYEEPLYAPDGTMFLPDFTVKFRGETYYWEHVGRLDLPDYRAHWEIKEKWYEKHFPGRLLITYEGKDLSIAAMDIIKGHK